MNNPIENNSTLRYLRKQHKGWSEEKIKAEAEKIWDQYVEENKEKLEQGAKQDKEAFEKALNREFLNFLMDS